MKLSKWLWVVLAALLAATLACGTGSSTEAPPTNPPSGSTGGTSGGSGGEDAVSVEVTNTTDVEICEIYIAESEEEDWGPNQLDSDTIPVGETYTINNIPAGTFDFKAVDCDGNVLERIIQAEIGGKDYTWSVERSTVALTINNYSTSIGCKVFLASPGTEDWGPNIVDEGTTIDPDTFITFTGIEPGTYDVHAETCSGNYSWDWADVDLTEDAELNMNN